MKYITSLLVIALLFCCKNSNVAQNNEATNQKNTTENQTTSTPNNALETVENNNLQAIVATNPVEIKSAEPEKTLESLETTISTKSEEQPKPKEAFNHDVWNQLLKTHVSDEGHVNYKGFQKDKTQLKQYIAQLATNMPNNDWQRNDVLAYWINAYNALTVDLILKHYPVSSIKDIKNPWDDRLWKLGDKWYNLSEIEHEILRKMDEPRIHFAIVCASFSCPKLSNEAFTANDLEQQLTKSTKGFLSDSKRNIITADELKISKIFQWFSKDFKQNGSITDFINKYTDIDIASNAKTKYLDYNWALNE